MLRNISFILIIALVCVSGCMEKRSSQTQVDSHRLDSPVGMIEYLRKQNLPALKNVEIWENQYGPGLKLTTAHYEIYTTLLEPLMLSQVPGFVESAYRGYQSQLPSPIETMNKFRIYLFAQREQWEIFTKSFTGAQAPLYLKIKAGAYYLKDSCVAYNIGRERTFSVLGHEGWHQFNKRHFKFRLPSWLDEGIAMLFETNRYDKGMFYFEPAKNLYRLGSLKQMLIQDKMIPLDELISMNPGEAIIASDDKVTAFYAQSYALVRFLREEKYGKRLRRYHQMLLGGLRGDWPISEQNRRIAADRRIPLTVQWNRTVGNFLFKQYITDDINQIEQEYLMFCRKIVYHIHFQ